MARRNSNLAGLAALAALGYMATRGRDETRGVGQGRGESVESETRLQTPENRRQTPARTEDDRDIGMISGASPSGLYRNTESSDLFSMNRPEEAPAVSLSKPEKTPPTSRAKSPRRNVAGDYTRQGGATAEEIQAYNRARSMTPRPTQTREEAIAQIPTSTGSQYASVASDIDPSLREDSTEFGRNVSNTLAALTPLGGGFGKVGAELATAKGAAERAARSRQLAEEAIRAQKPTKFTSTKSSASGRTSANTKSRVKKFNEEEAGIEFKRGGLTSSASKRADGIAQRGKTRGRLV